MEYPNGTQSAQSDHIPETRQVDDKTENKAERRMRVRSGEGTVAYWRSRLFRNSYRDREGTTVLIPEYYVRMRRDGVTKRVRLHTSDKERAAEEALRLSERLSREGWNAVTAIQARLPASPTIDEFCAAYEDATASMERAPRPISVRTYVACFKQLCGLAGVSRLRELNRDAIEGARMAYRRQARAEKRAESAIQNSFAKILRNAAACFSKDARAVLARNGLALENPFDGVKRSQDIQPVSPLPHTVIERVWKEAPLLRDGDPEAKDPAKSAFSREHRKKHGRFPQWRHIDFRQPHPDAYAALLLALGAGLRAREIDRARWSWLKFDAKGDCFIEVRAEEDFVPKGGSLRLIKIPRELHDAIAATRHDMASPYVIGGDTVPENDRNGDLLRKAATGESYRRPETFRVVNLWLRQRGVEEGKVRGHPLHRLRKQFGSELATEFGLFAAQKLLGHSSPTVTARYYAAQTELPTLSHIKIVG